MRVILQIGLLCGAILGISGCSEYNRTPTVSEANSLSNIIQLTGGFTGAGEASFSRDQQWMIFRAVPMGQKQFQVYVAKVAQSEGAITGIERPISITPVGARSGSGAFFPEGGSIIFSSTAPNAPVGKLPRNMQIFRVDGWEEVVGMAGGRSVDLAQNPLTTDPPYNGECSYSPDGKWICFTSARGGNPNIYVMHADGTHIVQITKTTGYDGAASFSPDGKYLAYQSDRDADHRMDIFICRLTVDRGGEITGSTDETALTHENINTNPAWNPDGTHIVYATSRHGTNNFEIYLMSRSGNDKTRITFFPGADLFPKFSPDGRYLMWSSKRAPDGTTQVFVGHFQFPRGS